MTEDQINRIKNLAAVRALEAYGKAIEEMLTEASIDQLDQTEHVHTAVMLGEGGAAIAIIAHWKFVADPKVIAKLLAAQRGKRAAS